MPTVAEDGAVGVGLTLAVGLALGVGGVTGAGDALAVVDTGAGTARGTAPFAIVPVISGANSTAIPIAAPCNTKTPARTDLPNPGRPRRLASAAVSVSLCPGTPDASARLGRCGGVVIPPAFLATSASRLAVVNRDTPIYEHPKEC
ncbi:MAG: hypothetical protein R2719_03735 [Micropruina sp.]|nr:hypothetical protein [Micropruina sp.]